MILSNILEKENLTPETFVENLKDFAITCGWTVDHYLPGSAWIERTPPEDPPHYQLISEANNNYFLQIHSTGYGAQDLTFRFYINTSHNDPRARAFYASGQRPGFRFIDYYSSAHPVTQYTINYYPRGTIPENITRCWFFGNNKFLMIFIEAEATAIQNMCYGTIELFDQAETQGNFVGIWQQYNTVAWYNGYMKEPVNELNEWTTSDTYYQNGAKRRLYTNIYSNGNGSYTDYYHYRGFRHGIRSTVDKIGLATPIVKPILMSKDNTGLYYEAGYLPVYRFKKQQTMLAGEKVINGTKEFYTFSPFKSSDWRAGIAVRVK